MHSNIQGRIPFNFGRFPKNAMDESHKVDNKFLNSHLGEIEEAIHKNLLDDNFKQDFLKQQKTYHGNSDILNHDGIFNADLATGVPLGDNFARHYPFIVNPVRYRAAFGADLFTDVDNGNEAGNFTGAIFFSVTVTGGFVSQLYDQIGIDLAVANGNIRLAAYSDTGAADVLQAETVSETNATGFPFFSVPEYSLPTTNVWLAEQVNNTSNTFRTFSGNVGRQSQVQGFGAFPATATPVATGNPMRLKTGHT